MIQVQKCKCGSVIAACAEPSCYTDVEWLQTVRERITDNPNSTLTLEMVESAICDECKCTELPDSLKDKMMEVVLNDLNGHGRMLRSFRIMKTWFEVIDPKPKRRHHHFYACYSWNCSNPLTYIYLLVRFCVATVGEICVALLQVCEEFDNSLKTVKEQKTIFEDAN